MDKSYWLIVEETNDSNFWVGREKCFISTAELKGGN